MLIVHTYQAVCPERCHLKPIINLVGVHVCGAVNLVRQRLDVHIEALLDLVQYLKNKRNSWPV